MPIVGPVGHWFYFSVVWNVPSGALIVLPQLHLSTAIVLALVLEVPPCVTRFAPTRLIPHPCGAPGPLNVGPMP